MWYFAPSCRIILQESGVSDEPLIRHHGTAVQTGFPGLSTQSGKHFWNQMDFRRSQYVPSKANRQHATLPIPAVWQPLPGSILQVRWCCLEVRSLQESNGVHLSLSLLLLCTPRPHQTSETPQRPYQACFLPGDLLHQT